MFIFWKDQFSWHTVVIHRFRREKAQISNIRSGIEGKSTSATEIKKLIKGYYNRFYASEFENGWNGQNIPK